MLGAAAVARCSPPPPPPRRARQVQTQTKQVGQLAYRYLSWHPLPPLSGGRGSGSCRICVLSRGGRDCKGRPRPLPRHALKTQVALRPLAVASTLAFTLACPTITGKYSSTLTLANHCLLDVGYSQHCAQSRVKIYSTVLHLGNASICGVTSCSSGREEEWGHNVQSFTMHGRAACAGVQNAHNLWI